MTLALLLCSLFSAISGASTQSSDPALTPVDAESSTSNDLFIMFGSDLVRPGLLPKANYNIGLGHTFGFLKKDRSATRSRSPTLTKTPVRTDSCTPTLVRTQKRSD